MAHEPRPHRRHTTCTVSLPQLAFLCFSREQRVDPAAARPRSPQRRPSLPPTDQTHLDGCHAGTPCLTGSRPAHDHCHHSHDVAIVPSWFPPCLPPFRSPGAQLGASAQTRARHDPENPSPNASHPFDRPNPISHRWLRSMRHHGRAAL